MWRAPFLHLFTIHLSRFWGTPQYLTLDAVERMFANLSRSTAEVTAMVSSPMLIAKHVAAVLLVFCRRQVSASEW